MQKRIFDRRVAEVCKQIVASKSLAITDQLQVNDDLGGTSCGLICGK